MNFKNTVNKVFERIIGKYGLKIASISENEVILFSSKYILSFLLHAGEVELVYIERNNEGELYQYSIDSFIANSISQEDREQIKEKVDSESTVEIHLALLSQTLEKNGVVY